MLTSRENNILKLIVEEYIKLAKPVSSNLICKRLKCSSATVRSEMKALEDIGLLEKTHTSSGRVPSEKGYRYYVDNLMHLKKMKAEDMLKLQQDWDTLEKEWNNAKADSDSEVAVKEEVKQNIHQNIKDVVRENVNEEQK